MSTPVFPQVASFESDTRGANNVLLGAADHVTQVYDMPANTAIAQYEAVVISGSTLAKMTGAPTAGQVMAIAAYAADNLTATSADLRTPKVALYVSGHFNETKLTFPGSTAAAWRAAAAGNGIVLRNPLVFPGA